MKPSNATTNLRSAEYYEVPYVIPDSKIRNLLIRNSNSEEFIGIDGPWSAVRIMLDTKAYSVFPATVLQQSFFFNASVRTECNFPEKTHLIQVSNNPDQQWMDCDESHGGTFNVYKGDMEALPMETSFSGVASNSRYYPEQWLLWQLARSNFTATGLIGNMSLGNLTDKHSPWIPTPVMVSNNVLPSWMGLLGMLTIVPNEQSKLPQGYPNFLQGLKSTKQISSLSYGYTAGSFNRNKSHGSLVLGGYDKNRFIPNNMTFRFDERHPELPTRMKLIKVGIDGAIGSIPKFNTSGYHSYDVALEQNEFPLPSGFATLIDSSQPFIDLPLAICNQIASAFQLEFNSSSSQIRYFIPDDIHAKLSESGAGLSFTFMDYNSGKDNNTSADKITIRMGYPSLNLFNGMASTRNTTTHSRYMPLRPGARNQSGSLGSWNSMGQAFLQDAYLSLDYEKNKFSISQVNWDADLEKRDIVSLRPWPKQKHLSKPAIAGIAVGSALIALVILISFILCWVRKRRRVLSQQIKNLSASEPSSVAHATLATELRSSSELKSAIEVASNETFISSELDSSTVTEMSNSLSDHPCELPSNQIHELEASTKLDVYPNDLKAQLNPSRIQPMIPPAVSVNSRIPTVLQASMRDEDFQLASPIPKTPAEYYRRRTSI
jgi:hypothetical protein